jgi:hypothetical protein
MPRPPLPLVTRRFLRGFEGRGHVAHALNGHAAITYLAPLVPGLLGALNYAVVAGVVTMLLRWAQE